MALEKEVGLELTYRLGHDSYGVFEVLASCVGQNDVLVDVEDRAAADDVHIRSKTYLARAPTIGLEYGLLERGTRAYGKRNI